MPLLHHDLAVLQEVAEVDVLHELVAMVATVRLPVVGVESLAVAGLAVDPVQVVVQSLLEGHLIHVRNLHGFLSRRAVGLRDPDEVVAEHFFDGDWVGTSPLTADEVKEIHSRVAHVSSRRRTLLSSDGWSGVAGPWAPKVVDHFRRFVDELGAAHPDRAGWFVPALEVAERAVSA